VRQGITYPYIDIYSLPIISGHLILLADQHPGKLMRELILQDQLVAHSHSGKCGLSTCLQDSTRRDGVQYIIVGDVGPLMWKVSPISTILSSYNLCLIYKRTSSLPLSASAFNQYSEMIGFP
jgi:hypothetical protein